MDKKIDRWKDEYMDRNIYIQVIDEYKGKKIDG